jgi:thioredoxin reductase
MDTLPPSRPVIDPKSAAGKFPCPDQKTDVLVIGAGPAGIAAALKAAEEGRSVLLVDEHPVTAAMAGLDVPYLFGGRATGAIANQARMIEQVAGNMPGLDAVYDAGVEVMLGVSLWGVWVNGPGLQVLPCPIAGLATDECSWLCGFDTAIIATGARDLVLSFKGSDQPGVVGAQALHILLKRYEAFAGRSIVILGSNRLALETALLALDKGLTVAALIEVRDQPQGPADLLAALQARGIQILCGHAPLVAETTTDGVIALQAVPVTGGEAIRLACDTICLAVGLVPVVELLNVIGVPLVMDARRGGFVPVCNAEGVTPVAGISVTGDCAGISDNPGLEYRLDWMRALLATGGDDVLACTCEEVTRRELFSVSPPRYLGPPGTAIVKRDLASLLADGPLDHDQFKRLTRVSMGPCQGRRCREQIALLLAIGANIDPATVKLAGYRAPVRPLSLAALSAPAEDEAGWDVWFGILSQWVPYAEIGTEREAAYRAADMHL